MDAKKIRNVGIVGVLGFALALGAGVGISMPAGAQSQEYTGNAKPDPSHPVVSLIKASSVILATTPNSTYEVRIDASTLVVKDGKFASISALKVGDKVQINPSITLPNGLEGAGVGSKGNNPSAPEQSSPGDPDKSEQSGNAGGSGQRDSNEGSPSSNPPAVNPPAAPLDPDNKDQAVPSASTGSGQSATGEGSAVGTPSAVSLIWVTSDNSMLLGGVVHWSQGGTVILNIPGVGYSEYAIHTASDTGYQQALSAGAAPSAANAADMKVGASVIVLGSDGGPNNRGFFTAKAVLLLPASGKLR